MVGDNETVCRRGRPRGRPADAAQTRRCSAHIASLSKIKNSNRRTPSSSRLPFDIALINKPSNPRVQQLQRHQMMRMTMPMQQITTKSKAKARAKRAALRINHHHLVALLGSQQHRAALSVSHHHQEALRSSRLCIGNIDEKGSLEIAGGSKSMVPPMQP